MIFNTHYELGTVLDPLSQEEILSTPSTSRCLKKRSRKIRRVPST
jgi:hypothetical protein